MRTEPYYREALSRVHEVGFGHHASAQAPGILALLEPVLTRGGLVLEIGCGSGHLTEHLVEAGHQVLATDASPAMLEIAEAKLGDRASFASLVLPEDEAPSCDAVVSTGHVLNYLADERAVAEALSSLCRALRPGGLLALDLLEVAYGAARSDLVPGLFEAEGLFLATEFELPSPTRFVRRITVFSRRDDGCWEHSFERHENVLLETGGLVDLLGAEGVEAELLPGFGRAPLPAGMVALVGHKR